MPENMKANVSQPSAVSAITQSTAIRCGRAKIAPSRPAAGGKCEKSGSVASVIGTILVHNASPCRAVSDAGGAVSVSAAYVLIG